MTPGWAWLGFLVRSALLLAVIYAVVVWIW